jgi:hypothetical protein
MDAEAQREEFRHVVQQLKEEIDTEWGLVRSYGRCWWEGGRRSLALVCIPAKAELGITKIRPSGAVVVRDPTYRGVDISFDDPDTRELAETLQTTFVVRIRLPAPRVCTRQHG